MNEKRHGQPEDTHFLDGFDRGHDSAYRDVLEAMVKCVGYAEVLALLEGLNDE